MSSVRAVLDALASGSMGLDEATADFAARTWPAKPTMTDAQFWGVTDDDPGPPDSWDTVDADSRLTGAQYSALAAAYGKAKRAV